MLSPSMVIPQASLGVLPSKPSCGRKFCKYAGFSERAGDKLSTYVRTVEQNQGSYRELASQMSKVSFPLLSWGELISQHYGIVFNLSVERLSYGEIIR
ncbi:MAG: hypothetical protein ABR909_13975 [Candidatus Bathyarchaeia archaeon]